MSSLLELPLVPCKASVGCPCSAPTSPSEFLFPYPSLPYLARRTAEGTALFSYLSIPCSQFPASFYSPCNIPFFPSFTGWSCKPPNSAPKQRRPRIALNDFLSSQSHHTSRDRPLGRKLYSQKLFITMATSAQTTGINPQSEELRRRNVNGQSTTPAVAQASAPEKSKEKVKYPKRCRSGARASLPRF